MEGRRPEPTCRFRTKCTANRENGRIWWCDGCRTYYCEADWPSVPQHDGQDSGHEKEYPKIKEWISTILQGSTAKDQKSNHEDDERNAWFGIDAVAKKSFLNEALFTDILLQSEIHGPGLPQVKQFPSIVSFIGATGAGKSTIVKGLILLPNASRDDNEDTERLVPVTGRKGTSFSPTSSDIHLYPEPQSINSREPLLFADCEGFLGGQQPPSGFSKLGIRAAKYACKVWDFVWKDAAGTEGATLTRKECVQDIYPRMLYAFSDVLCYVIQQSPQCLENVITELINWADNVYHTSLNQSILPHALLILNNISLQDNAVLVEEEAGKILELMSNWNIDAQPGLAQLAARWNRLSSQGTKFDEVTNVKQLFYRYFRGISVICIPPASGKEGEVCRQFEALQRRISELTKAIRKDRDDHGAQVSASQLDRFLNRAFHHFATSPDRPFDFARHMIPPDPLPKNLLAHAIDLMHSMRLVEHSFSKLESDVADLLSSYVAFRESATEPKYGRLEASMRAQEYCQDYSAAYKTFHESTRCWYRTTGGPQCQNMKNRHVKGHQDKRGRVLDAGSYCTPYGEERHGNFVNILGRKLASALEAVLVAENSRSVVEKHAKVLEQHTKYFKPLVASNTCLACLAAVAGIELGCGHTICSLCLSVLASRTAQDGLYQIEKCPLCGDIFGEISGAWTQMQLKPLEAGPRVLAIDGGGVRGVISARILQLLEQELGLGIPLFDFFDVIIGTSSGGIIALALGKNLWSARGCLESFKKFAKGAFKPRDSGFFGYFSATLDSYYEPQALEDSLRAAFCGEHQLDKRLIGDPARLSYLSGGSSNEVVTARDIKVGVTAVKIEGGTVILGNYRRELSKDNIVVYTEDAAQDKRISVWQAARCSAAAPGIFPVYQAPNGQRFQDGGMEQNNPIGLAIQEAGRIWPQEPRPHIAVSVGTGSADKRVDKDKGWFRAWRHSWIRRCVDSFERKLDSEELWRGYSTSLCDADRARHYRLNVGLSGLLPTLDATDQIEPLDKETTAYFGQPVPRMTLSQTAEALLAALFYVTKPALKSVGNHHWRATSNILCQLHLAAQASLLGRLQDSGCTFVVHYHTEFKIPDDKEEGQPFRMVIQWDVTEPRGDTSVELVFRREKEQGVAEADKARKYHINASPVSYAVRLE